MNILVTGASGNIGLNLVEHLSKTHQVTATDISLEPLELAFSKYESVTIQKLDITDKENCRKVLEHPFDWVIHLAGIPDPDSSFEAVLKLNVEGSHNVLDSLVGNSSTKIIVASSAQVNESYPVDVQTKESDVTSPKNLYGVSKTFLEQLSRYYVEQKSLTIFALRIGAYDEIERTKKPLNRRDLSAYLDPADFNHMIDCLIATPITNKFSVYNCISDNTYKRLDISKARKEINYLPTADAFKLAGYTFIPQS
ncbi:NAD-dependent epimerase/dehydratase family protein [Vagococcus sp.]|uniref:NAD-dependent epimerase/dehydratase family protein n=1 Tax=Vagococcus sp. TaxID=1933889 RepID=UPI002FCA0E17